MVSKIQLRSRLFLVHGLECLISNFQRLSCAEDSFKGGQVPYWEIQPQEYVRKQGLLSVGNFHPIGLALPATEFPELPTTTYM